MYQNLKIAITDEVHLKAVCNVLESMKYTRGACIGYENTDKYSYVVAHQNGIYAYYCHAGSGVGSSLITLTELLAMRDKKFMENIHA